MAGDKQPDLDQRIDAAQARASQEQTHSDDKAKGMRIGWRMVGDLVAGVVVGFAMGWVLDRVFGTTPIFILIFTLLGSAAGMKNMLLSAKELNKKPEDEGFGGNHDPGAVGGKAIDKRLDKLKE